MCPHLWQKGAKEVLLAKQTYIQKFLCVFLQTMPCHHAREAKDPNSQHYNSRHLIFLAALKFFDYAPDVFLLAPV